MLEKSDWKTIQVRNNTSFSEAIKESKFGGVLQIQHNNIATLLLNDLYSDKNTVDTIQTWIETIRNLAEDNSVSLINKSTTWHAIEKLTAIAERLAGQHS